MERIHVWSEVINCISENKRSFDENPTYNDVRVNKALFWKNINLTARTVSQSVNSSLNFIMKLVQTMCVCIS